MFSREDLIISHRILRGMLEADEAVPFEERSFFQRALDELGFSEEERSRINQGKVTAEELAEAARLPSPLRQTLFHMLLRAAMVDGRLDPRERAFAMRMGRLMHVETKTVEYLIEQELRAVAGVEPS